MGIAPHALVGSFIAVFINFIQRKFKKKIPTVWVYIVVVVLTFFSHFVLDAIPHWHYANERTSDGELTGRAMADFLIAGTLMMLCSRGFFDEFAGFWRRRLLILGAFMAVLPDMITTSARLFHLGYPLLKQFYNFHHYLHTRTEVSVMLGVVTQLAVMIISCTCIYWLTSPKRS